MNIKGVAVLTRAEESRFGGVNRDGSFSGSALAVLIFDALFLVGDLLAHADITLNTEVSVLASLCAFLVDALFSRAASRLLLMSVTDIGLSVELSGLVDFKFKVILFYLTGTEKSRAETNFRDAAWAHAWLEAITEAVSHIEVTAAITGAIT